MTNRRDTIIQWFSLLACAIIITQVVFILTSGEAFCLNDGCRVVEKLTIVPPLFINLTGLVYFIVLFSVSRWSTTRKRMRPDRPHLLLLLGLATEGVLLGYQLFVLRTFCSYCLVIFTIIVLLNILYGWQQMRYGLPLFAAVLAAFAVLNFSPASLLALQNKNLDGGTYGVRKCANPVKKLYFFFSADCPHCKNVLTVLDNCNSCDFHFNPIDKNQGLTISDIDRNQSYNPSLNRVILSMLNIKTIPVLLVQDPEGFTFIKGEKQIIDFISRECFVHSETTIPETFRFDDSEGMNLFEEQEGECAIEVECPDEPGMNLLQSPTSR
jgi:hypothetical protein